MNCPYCNNPVKEGALFCTECGKKLPVAQETSEKPSQNHQNTIATDQQAPIQSVQPKKSRGMLMGIITVVLVLAAMFGIYYLLNDSIGGKHKTAYTIDNDDDDEDDNDSEKEDEYNVVDSVAEEVGFDTTESVDSHSSPAYQNMRMVGSIDNKYPITMDLEQNGSDLRGSYYYNRNGPDKRLNVYGQLDGSRFRLQEYDNDDNNTGNFIGTYHNGRVTGTFSLPDGKTMSFELEVVN
ncbi:MAG: zinc ribbon domain-containing protein [Bacteroidaceae bacterium]|nr:zinc ribbon domain-containing protein [Bacteroidaceae bacterium]